MPPKTFRIACLLLVSAMVCSTSFAKKKHQTVAGAFVKILEISPMSVTVDAGKDVQESYNITAATKATLNGIAVTPDDLRAGMVAKITLGSDNETVVTLDAKPAPRAAVSKFFHPFHLL